MIELILELIISLLITVFFYLLIPVVFVICKKQYRKPTILGITIINGVSVWLIFNILRGALGMEFSPNVIPAFLWSSIGYSLLKKKCLLNENHNNNEETLIPEDKTMPHNTNAHMSLSPADEVPIKQNGCIYGSDIKLQSETQEKSNYYESNNSNLSNSDNYQKSSHTYVTEHKQKKSFSFVKWIILIVVMIFVFLIGFFIGKFVATDNWEKLYYPLNNDYKNLVYEYNILLDEYNNAFVKKEEFEEFETLYFAGIGNDTIKGIKVPSGNYYITCKHQGNSNCIAFFYDSIDASWGDLIANFIGEGSEVYGYSGIIDNGYINIEADGNWSITIEKAE